MTRIDLPEAIDVSRVHRTAAYRAVVDAWHRPVAIGCSGGIDSVALLVAASVAFAKARVAPMAAVHVDHGTRPESRCEGRFVAGLAARLQVPFVSVTIAHEPMDTGGGLEAVLRTRRYAALAGVAHQLGIDTVVVAHTFDDQVETTLLKLVSGSSSLAALGMPHERELETAAGTIRVLRPLLGLRRATLAGILEDAGVPHISDPTNDDLDFRRNRVRHRLIPEFERLDPGFGAGLLRAVRHASRDAELAEQLTDEAEKLYVQDVPSGVSIDREFLKTDHPAITSRAVLRATRRLVTGDNREVTFERVEAVRLAASRRSGATIELPYGLIARVERSRIVIRYRREEDER